MASTPPLPHTLPLPFPIPIPLPLSLPHPRAMSSLLARRSTRYILLAFALIFSLWLWRPAFHFQSPPQVPSAFIPTKLYEPGAVACTDNLAHEPSLVPL